LKKDKNLIVEILDVSVAIYIALLILGFLLSSRIGVFFLCWILWIPVSLYVVSFVAFELDIYSDGWAWIVTLVVALIMSTICHGRSIYRAGRDVVE
jgi:hypothetical protein